MQAAYPNQARRYGGKRWKATAQVIKGALFPRLYPFTIDEDEPTGATGIGTVIGPVTIETADRSRSWKGYEVDYSLRPDMDPGGDCARQVAAELIAKAIVRAEFDEEDSRLAQLMADVTFRNGVPSSGLDRSSDNRLVVIGLVPEVEGGLATNFALTNFLEDTGVIQPVHVVGKDRHHIGDPNTPVHVYTKTIEL